MIGPPHSRRPDTRAMGAGRSSHRGLRSSHLGTSKLTSQSSAQSRLIFWGRYLVLSTGEGIVYTPSGFLPTCGRDKAMAVQRTGAAARL
jgi:hypothetical protein